ncbi:FAD-binding oxidoreductase [Leucobacter weissii]|uniref:FAD-binding oxidoreductase n=1 Tax=Leucobacter weissii TaxID=1983706 RepID=A0A939MPN7_9MICO|nr:FAD-binding oxidoreductase [Leucobacter weissii]
MTPQRTDVVVIGGGIAGLSVAARLSRRLRVTVLEREPRLALHASGRNARQMQPSYGPAHIRALTRRTIELVREIEAEGRLTVLTPRRLGWVARESGRGAFEAMLAEHPELEALEGDAVSRRLPLADPGVYRLGAVDREAYEVDVAGLIEQLARSSRSNGARILTGAPAGRIRRTGAAWTVETPSGRHSAPVVVDAAGAWADRIAELAGIPPRGIRSYLRTVVVTEPLRDGGIADGAMISDVEGDFYARPEGAGLLLSPSDQQEVEAGDAQPHPGVVAETLRRARERLTVPVPPLARAWAGLRSMSGGSIPESGWDAEAEGFFWLAGQGGYGLQTSLALAEKSARLVMSRTQDI